MVPILVRRALGGVAALAAAGALIAVPATASGAATAPTTKVQHCVVNITAAGTSPVRCYGSEEQAQADGASYSSTLAAKSGGAVALLSGDVWEATHYDGLGLTGSSLIIYGTTACSGWLNLAGPGLTPWNNKISSTESNCTSWHFDGFNLAGSVESINAPGGDLTLLDNRASSLQYT